MSEPPVAAAGSLYGDWRPGANPWLITAAVMLATFMEVLDTTIVTVAVPHIAGSLSASNEEATWVLTSYWFPMPSSCRPAAGSPLISDASVFSYPAS